MQLPHSTNTNSIRTSGSPLFGACAVGAACLMAPGLSLQVLVQADEPAPPRIKRVRAADVGKTVRIVGSLGHDLGEVLTIRGKWEYRDDFKFGSLFHVTHVNGAKLDHSVDFRPVDLPDHDYLKGRKMPKTEDGDVWGLKVVELGGWRGQPAGLAGLKYPRVMPSNPHGGGFSTWLEVFDYSDPKPKTRPSKR